MALWPQWVEALQRFEPSLQLHRPLMQLADDDDSLERMRSLVERRQELGLRLIHPQESPIACVGGLHSDHDGRVEPQLLQRALRQAMATLAVQQHPAAVTGLEQIGTNQRPRWRVDTAEDDSREHNAVVICAALRSDALLRPLGHNQAMTAVLGQVVDLELRDGPSNWQDWPAVLSVDGFNLVPTQPGRLLLGATLEPGAEASKETLELMLKRIGGALPWLTSSTPVGHWSGLRARPVDRPAPLLEQLEPGLLLATGHYRNGVLLAPATAEWVATSLTPLVSVLTNS